MTDSDEDEKPKPTPEQFNKALRFFEEFGPGLNELKVLDVDVGLAEEIGQDYGNEDN